MDRREEWSHPTVMRGRATLFISTAVWLLLLTAARGLSYGQRPTIHSLCEVLKSPEKFAGRVFEVRGRYIASREIVGLYAIDCKPTIPVDGYERPAAAAVGIRGADEIDGIKVDRHSLQKLGDAVSQNRKLAYSPGLKVVLKVRLNTPDEAQSYVMKDGHKEQPRFGHLGVFAFRIDIIAVEEIEGEPLQ